MTFRMAIVVVTILLSGLIHGQVRLSADSTALLIGDQVQVYLGVTPEPGMTWINPEVSLPDTLGAVEILSSTPVKEMDQGTFLKSWRIAVFDTGYVLLPEMGVVVAGAGKQDTIYSNTLPLEVRGVVVDSTGLLPIKPILREPFKLIDLLPWVAGIAFVAVVIGVYFMAKRLQRKHQETEPVPEIPEDILALEKLDELEAKKLWQQGKVKAYHSELSYITREYLERRYHILALESTTNEILSRLKQRDLDPELIRRCRDMMQLEDMVKFAKAEPPVESHVQYLEFARAFIRETRRRIAPEEKEPADHAE